MPTLAWGQSTCEEVRRVRAQARASGVDNAGLALLEQQLCGGFGVSTSGQLCEPLRMMSKLSELASEARPRWARRDEVQQELAEIRRVRRLSCNAGTPTANVWLSGLVIQASPGSIVYPGGKQALHNKRWYYPTGGKARSGLGQWFYPTGRRARSAEGAWYDPQGHRVTPTDAQRQAACRAMGADGCFELSPQGRALALMAQLWRSRQRARAPQGCRGWKTNPWRSQLAGNSGRRARGTTMYPG